MTSKKEQYESDLTELKTRLSQYLQMEQSILTGDAQSYSLGSRSKSKYNMTLSEVRNAIKDIKEEIRELEGLILGVKSRKVVSVIPRF